MPKTTETAPKKAVKKTAEKKETTTVAKKTTKSKKTVEVAYETVAQKAYELYLERGGVNGDAFNDWVRAEELLRN